MIKYGFSWPAYGIEGEVLSVGNNTVKVALPSLGYMMFAEVETANVKYLMLFRQK
jgi:hypothetical protein